MPNFVVSLLLAIAFSFATPVVVLGVMLASLYLVSYIPGMAIIGISGADSIWQFLAVFGSGCPLEGILTIGLACAFVGAMFDTCAFYRYQTLRGE